MAGVFRNDTLRKYVLPPLLLTLGAAAILYLSADRRLAVVLSDRDGAVLRRLPTRPGGRFSVVFTHSYAKSRVEEVFEIVSSDEFRLRETWYADFGAGLPHEEAGGQKMDFIDGRIRLSGYDLPFRRLELRVGHIADHKVETADGHTVRLADLSRPGSEVHIDLRKISLWSLWFD